MHLFYTPDLQDDTYRLSEEESKHCVRVLRLTEGDKLCLVDGKGLFCEAVITSAHPKACLLQVVERKPNFSLSFFRIWLSVPDQTVCWEIFGFRYKEKLPRGDLKWKKY